LKIVYLHQYFNTPDMAGSTRSYELARRMVEAGHEVAMVTSLREPDNSKLGWFETEVAGINVYWYPVPYRNQMNYRERLFAFFMFAKAARNKLLELDGDVIFATSTPLTIALPAVMAARKKAIPMVFEIRDLWPEMPIALGVLDNPVLRFAALRLERWAYKNSSAIVALSPGMKAGVVKVGYPANKVAVIPNSSDNYEFRYRPILAKQFGIERQWLEDSPLLVYIGTFGKVNGVGFMVPLAKALLERGSNVRILLVGDGAERAGVLQLAQQEGVYLKNLFIEEPIPKKEIPALLSAATISACLFIDLPEMQSNSANKFFDSLASGTPVILNYGGWMHDLVRLSRCGLPMWRKSVMEVAIELDNKMNDPVWIKESGKAARELAETYFDRDLLAKQLITVLQLAVDKRANSVSEVAPGIYDFEE
jgi:glycosyltransferase involved in cell wall biosynthesis